MIPRLALAAGLLAAPAAQAAEQVPPPNLPAPDSWEPRQTGIIHVLDKVSAQSTTLTLHVGDTVSYQTLSITLSSCQARPPALPADSAGRLAVVDSHTGGAAFTGWLLAGEPGTSQFENPVYDIQLASCQ